MNDNKTPRAGGGLAKQAPKSYGCFIPKKSEKDFPVVGIGASAGGLEAFAQLLSSLPSDTAMGFVLFPHLAPQYESHLTEILSRTTRLPIHTVHGGETVLPDRVYVVPPNREMVIRGGILHLCAKSGRRNPIDGFFSSLAKDQGRRAIGILLSGEGTDGTKGLQAIKAGGGVTYAQDEKTAAHLRMPQSAARSGCVDFVLPPVKIAAELGRRGRGARRPAGIRKPGRPGLHEDESLQRIFALLKASKGVEFDFYNRSMLRRRILRRMSLRRIGHLEGYIRELEKDPVELDALYGDVLISVTSFFREPAAFKALRSRLYPRLLKRGPAKPIRIWVSGCSTGQEAYSHAINLSEFLSSKGAAQPFQIFATDVNASAIRIARAGYYPREITSQLSPERLRRFFVEAQNGYRIAPAIRERCVFARQDLLQDPPFSSLDLISCRNLLIYLGPVLQEKALRIIHGALKPGGFLMLGFSEAMNDPVGRFAVVDAERKIFSKRAARADVLSGRASGAGHNLVEGFKGLATRGRSAAAADPQGASGERKFPRIRLAADSVRVLQLKEDLAASDDHLKSIIAEQESTNEELIASNEEVRQGIEALRRSNNDLTNLLANINIPIVLLGADLKIRLLTPAAEKELGIPRTEVGRPILDCRLSSRIPQMGRMLRKVLKTADVEGLQVQLNDRWYYLWVRPYRSETGATEGAVLILLDIDEGKRTEKGLRALHARIVSAQETERKRLSRELHDGIGQMLSGVKFRLQALPGEIGSLPKKARQRITSVTHVLDHAIAEIRRVSRDMMPSELEDLGLQPALQALCREFAERLGVPVLFRSAGAQKLVDPELSLAIFRIVQEALNNVGKHSRATRVAVSLVSRQRALKLTVSDNGRGFSGGRLRMAGRQPGGVANIRERAASVGGTVDFDSELGHGTRLVIRVPIDGAGKDDR
jgi:chemotaxis methyl-accepting protein methylase/two-component sensor histidine kinase